MSCRLPPLELTLPVELILVVLLGALMLYGPGGCGDQLYPDYTVPQLDLEIFKTEVQPILTARCGNPTTCHGSESRPFALYASGANRANPADIFLDPPLTDAELRANYDRSRAFAADDGDGPELLSKPLAERVGGARHTGGDVFFGVDDREYQTLSAWIEGRPGGSNE